MNYKRNFIKRERSNDKKIPAAKEPYRGVSWTNSNDKNTNVSTNNHKRKDEPFVLMFRDFLFFDVKSYECRNGDLYIRNIVDGIIMKRYFRMGSDDQLTVFKNRAEFDEFMDKVKEEGYMFGPQKSIKSYGDHHADLLRVRVLLKHGKFDEVKQSKSVINSVYGMKLRRSITNEHIKKLTDNASNQFILESYVPTVDPNTGKIVGFTSTWDGEYFTKEDGPLFFDKVAKVFEEAHINEALGRNGGIK